MVTLSDVKAANATLLSTKPFVAVVAGGTAGIGEDAVRGLATVFAKQGDQLRVYIVGRRQSAAEAIIADCRRVCPGGDFTFVGGNLQLMREVDRVCDQIIETETKLAEADNQKPKVDFLLCSQGILTLNYNETEEGIPALIALAHYSRMRFAVQLLPLLGNAPGGGHVSSVINAGVKPVILLDDLDLKDPKNRGLGSAFGHLCCIHNAFMCELARRNPGKIALSHIYPGFVDTNIAQTSDFNWVLKFLLKWVVRPLTLPFYIPHDEVGQRMVFTATDRFTPAGADQVPDVISAEGMNGQKGSGAYRITQYGETYPEEKQYATLMENGGSDKIFEHTIKVFEDIKTNGVHK
ncbi:hypothetical protein F5Y18DRAFT_409040 [Xylariaceae sp. FL1019]|nr:hypothetical protein F5Y18DRAFT_409040 [Xylariaceae sp. FL1019]